MRAEPAAESAADFPETIVGFKTAHYAGPEWIPVERTLQAGRVAYHPVMIDFGKYRHERPFAGSRGEITEEGHLNPAMVTGRERGVFFDVGHGGGSFRWRVAVRAVEEGFLPDTISSDLYSRSVNSGALDLLNVMSKFLCIGVNEIDVIRSVPSNATAAIGRRYLGTLSPGAKADITVLRIWKGDFGWVDFYGVRRDGSRRLECDMTIVDGKVVDNLNGNGSPAQAELADDYGPLGDPDWDATQDWSALRAI